MGRSAHVAGAPADQIRVEHYTNAGTRPRLVHVAAGDERDWMLPAQLSAFAGEGYDVTAIAPAGTAAEAIAAAGIRHIELEHPLGGRGPRHEIRATRELSDLMARLRPHLLHTHDPRPGVLGRLLRRSRELGVVVNSVHPLVNAADRRGRRTPGLAAQALAARLSDVDVVHDLGDLWRLRHLGTPRRKLVYVGSGVDLDRFGRTTSTRARALRLRRRLGIPPDAVIIGFTAIRGGSEELEHVLHVARLLRAAGHTDLELLVLREPEDPGRWTDRAFALRAQSLDLRFVDPRTDGLDIILGAVDTLVTGIDGDADARTVMAAHATGLPVITAETDANRRLVVDGFTGTLVPAGNASAVARAIAQLVDAPATRRAMSAAATRRAHTRFDQNRVFELTLAMYRDQLRTAGIIDTRPEPVIDLPGHDIVTIGDFRTPGAAEELIDLSPSPSPLRGVLK